MSADERGTRISLRSDVFESPMTSLKGWNIVFMLFLSPFDRFFRKTYKGLFISCRVWVAALRWRLCNAFSFLLWSEVSTGTVNDSSRPLSPSRYPRRRIRGIRERHQNAQRPGVERMLTRRRSDGDDVLLLLLLHSLDDDDVDSSDGVETTSIVRNCRFHGAQLR